MSADRPRPLSVAEVVDALGVVATFVASIPCGPGCPLDAKPYPTGPGTCPRCKASGKLHDLRARLSWQVPK